MKAKVYACVAEGLEEVECLAAADVMIRCGMDVILVSMSGERIVTGSHGIKIVTDILKGKKATCYPGFEDSLNGAEYTSQGVVTDGLITTARGLGFALDLGLELAGLLVGKETAAQVKAAIQYEK